MGCFSVFTLKGVGNKGHDFFSQDFLKHIVYNFYNLDF